MRKMDNFYVLLLAGLTLTACGNNQKTDKNASTDSKTQMVRKEEKTEKSDKTSSPKEADKKMEEKKSEGKKQTSSENTSMALTTKKLPAFTAKDQDGKPFTNKDLAKNQATVINLWFTGCSACIEEMSELNKLADDLKKQDGVDFISMCTDVNYDDSTKEAYQRIVKDKKPTYKALAVDYEGDMKDYLENIFVYPTTIVVDKNGKIIGDPIEGTLLPAEQKAKLQENINKAIESSKAS